MSKPRTIAFKKEHIELMDIRDHEMKLLNANPKFLTTLSFLENERSALTILHKGIILAILGYIEISKGVFEVWIIPSKYIHENAISFARLMWYYKNEIFDKFDWHRLQIVALDDELHNRWVTYLGFEKEGTLRSWNADKQDFNMWSIVR